MVYIELPLGMYTVSDETDEDYILFERLEVMDGDLILSYTYQVSVWVNETLRTQAAQGADYESFLKPQMRANWTGHNLLPVLWLTWIMTISTLNQSQMKTEITHSDYLSDKPST